MFRTEICDLFGIEYPVVQGGMVWVSYHELCAAVSEAGGLGTLAGGSMTADELREQIRLVKAKTKKPFAVNIPIVFPQSGDLLETALEGGVKVIVTSAGNPARFTQKIHDAGYRVTTAKTELPVTGMTCANCAMNIERTLNKKALGIVIANMKIQL